MRKLFDTITASAVAGVLSLALAAPAHAATGDVIVFKTEAEPLTTYSDPESGSCHRLDATAHVLINRTDSTLRIHSNVFCLGPGVPVKPNHGWHAPPSGVFAFSVA
ncbi:hypothetical protein [Salinactinospora qingdaonensis]|uniref:Secreted protein n=1 Tax=Salinactinospora qingdaonensis TaxID=702744 RepID=A0ABP7GDL8_9ACTN